ncbi:MAG: hypothetical protein EBZ48_03115 [Proteobacteria bacterium]|nr:hypothetical protein [Pseudomonadota bacterium]
MDYRSKQLVAAVLSTALGCMPHSGAAEHPIDVQRKAADGDYLAALISYEKLPKRTTTTQARIAAAKSSWALSLPDRALEEYDGALRQGGLSSVDQARIYLGKGIIHHQEGHPQLAVVQVQRALGLLENPSPLRAQVYALWGEALADSRSFAPAEERYLQALAEADPESKAEIYFLLGRVQLELGKYDAARANLERIPLKHERAADGLRLLSRIAAEQGSFSAAASWLEKGRLNFPDSFLDSWTDYMMLRGAIERKDREAAREIRSQAETRYPPSDPWLSLLVAAAEEFEWKELGGIR